LDHAFRQIAPEKGFAIHFVDLDRFKAVNDELGHPVGDGLLKSIAKRMRKVLRDNDLLARIGGDEFAIIQTNVTTAADAETLAHRLLSAVGGAHKVAGHVIPMSASVGVAIAPEHGTSAKELMKNVDVATYDAKKAGRGRVAVFDPSRQRRLVA
jgi:diguanylate cyclase (GGDEF)-like protein